MTVLYKIITAIIEGNIPWRIIGRRRKLTKTLEAYLDEIITQVELNKIIGRKNYYNEVLKNNIENFKSQYWDITKYEEKLKQYNDKL